MIVGFPSIVLERASNYNSISEAMLRNQWERKRTYLKAPLTAYFSLGIIQYFVEIIFPVETLFLGLGYTDHFIKVLTSGQYLGIVHSLCSWGYLQHEYVHSLIYSSNISRLLAVKKYGMG